MAHNELSHHDLRCSTFSLTTLHIDFFPIDSVLKNKADKKCSLNFGGERVKVNKYGNVQGPVVQS